MTRAHLKEHGISAVHVTHDQQEAEVMADRIVHWATLAQSERSEEGQ
jgi:ABC-type Fe3+/spermidine/putrescine transport system ATPase subunit